MYKHYVINAIMHEFPSHSFLPESMLSKSSRNDNLLHCCDDKIQIILPQWSVCCFTHSNSKCALPLRGWTLFPILSLRQEFATNWSARFKQCRLGRGVTLMANALSLTIYIFSMHFICCILILARSIGLYILMYVIKMALF